MYEKYISDVQQIGWMEVIKQCIVRRKRPDAPQEGCPVIYIDSQRREAFLYYSATVNQVGQ